MAKKQPPIVLMLIVFVAIAAGMFYGGGLMMRKQMLFADIEMTATHIMVKCRNIERWAPGGKLYIDSADSSEYANLSALDPDEEQRIPYTAINGFELTPGRVVKSVWIVVDGYVPKQFADNDKFPFRVVPEAPQ